MVRSLLASVAVVAVSSTVSSAAVVTYTDKTAFLNALSALNYTFQVEDFSGFGPGFTQLADPTAFLTTGTVIDLDQPSNDTGVEDERLKLSLENAPGVKDNLPNQTRVIEFQLPVQTFFAGMDFGNAAGNGSGIGNDSGARINAGDLVNFDPDTLYGGTDGNVSGDLGYVGFFGFISDSAFNSITFTSGLENQLTNDDDFRMDNLIFAAVPLPASIFFLIGGVAALAAVGRRRA